MRTPFKPKLLKLVTYNHPLLRSVMEPVQFPLSEEDKQFIEDMKYSIHQDRLREADAGGDDAAGMAANQWGINKRIFLFCPQGTLECTPEVIINPSYEPSQNSESYYAWEACFSVPLATGKVKRYKKIRAIYQNENGETTVKELSDWPAHVWQHETDHLNGLLYDDPNANKCIELKKFSSKAEIENFYNSLRQEAVEKNRAPKE